MKNFKKLLLLSLSIPVLHGWAQIENTTLPDGTVIEIDRSVFPDLVFDTIIRPLPADIKARREKYRGKLQLPDHVHNGYDKYFPPIFGQDGGSCGSAMSIGYMFTHELNSYRDADGSLPENIYPTHFTWLLTGQSSDKDEMARDIGIPNMVTYGGRTYSKLFGAQVNSDADYGWMQGYDKWYSAMWNRIADGIALGVTQTPEGRQLLKEWLYNRCGDETMRGGGLAGIGVASSGTWASIPRTEKNISIGVAGLTYVKSWGKSYDHALTVCGYDDRIEFDLDGDGIFGEVEEDEVGAWILANSWGNGWANKGFIYCPYKYSCPIGTNSGSWTPGCHFVRKDYRPLRTIKLKMDYSHRSELLLSAGVTDDIEATRPETTILFEHFRYAGNASGANPAPAVPMLGRWADGMHYEPMEFGYDLTDLSSSYDCTKPLKYFFIVKTKDGAIGSGHIYNASIMNYEIESDGVEITFEQENVEIKNNGGETIISVVVPGEQIYPATNLALADGVLTWTAPQFSSLALAGYHVYEGSTRIATLSAEQTSYTPSADATQAFTVKAVYKAGKYEQESGPSNAVLPQLPEKEVNNVLVMDKGAITIPTAINGIFRQITIEFWMYSDRNVSWSHQIGPGWGKFLFHNDASGNISVGWQNNETDRLNVSGILSATGRWKHIAIVIDGSRLTLYVDGMRKGQINSPNYSGLSNIWRMPFGHTSESQSWMGGLDEIRIWRTALTQAEIRSNMRMHISDPSLYPDLMLYLQMDTVQVGSRTMLRERVQGKHAYFEAAGTWETKEDDGPFTTEPTPTLRILDEEGTHMAGIPFCLEAQCLFSAVEWTWTVSDTDMPIQHGKKPLLTFDQAGTYTVNCTAKYLDGNTLTASKKVVVTEGEAPVADFEVLCDNLPAGDRFNFVNRSQGKGCTYQWSMPGAEVEQVGSTNASALFTHTGTFAVTLTATNPHGTNSTTKEVTVRESAPSALFDISESSIFLGEGIQLTDNSRYNPLSWRWELNNGSRILVTTEQSPFIVPTVPGIYDVSLCVKNDLGENTMKRGRYLIVSNDDPESCLNFMGNESLQITCPFTEQQKALTLDWWMRPRQQQGSICLTSTLGNLSTSVEKDGMLNVTLGSRTMHSEAGFVIVDEWHHYAITYNLGVVLFYRDGALFGTASAKLATRFPALGTITMGADGFRGQLDEVRLWGKALSEAQIKAYCNRHIDDIDMAQAENNLLLYYDFNQNSGDVIDRTSGGFDAQRIGFGPDGDAWNSALGVFTLDVEASAHGDVSSKYLTNYKNPFATATGTVNATNSSRFLPLLMRKASSKWMDANAVVANNITTGAHIDTGRYSDVTVEVGDNGFATTLSDYRFWQYVTLPAGKYVFGVRAGSTFQTQESRLVVCEGAKMVSEAECEEKAIAWCPLSKNSVSFTLEEEQRVSLGFIANLTGKACFSIGSFWLEGYPLEFIQSQTPTDVDAPLSASLKEKQTTVFDLQGRKVASGQWQDAHLKPGIYIQGGRKIAIGKSLAE